jgi:hypothetical protein
MLRKVFEDDAFLQVCLARRLMNISRMVIDREKLKVSKQLYKKKCV